MAWWTGTAAVEAIKNGGEDGGESWETRGGESRPMKGGLVRRCLPPHAELSPSLFGVSIVAHPPSPLHHDLNLPFTFLAAFLY